VIPAKAVSDYFATLPKGKRDTLQKLRKSIAAAAPKAEEAISYGLPAYKYMGRPLVSYNAAKNHCSFYVMSNTTLKSFRAELKDYDTDTGTIRFPIGGSLPAALVKKLVNARMKEIEAGAKRK